jgi:hypothetical protein
VALAGGSHVPSSSSFHLLALNKLYRLSCLSESQSQFINHPFHRLDSKSLLYPQPPLKKIAMASSTPLADTTSSTTEDQAWGDLLDSLIHESSLRPNLADEGCKYYTTTFHDETVFRWEVQRALDYVKFLCIHLHRVLSLISTHGEEALSTPSSICHLDMHAVLEGGIAEESELEKAQHSFAVHHTAISECLKVISSY